MKEANIYVPLWQKYKPAIQALMKAALEIPQAYQLSPYEFKTIGERPKSGYAFNLEIQNGKVVNKISNSAVARDLWAVINESKMAKSISTTHNYKITLSSSFLLKVIVI